MAYLTYDDFEVEDGYIYVIEVLGYCKIGKTKNPDNRFGEYTMLMKEPKVLLLDYVSDYHRLELDLHKTYEHKRTRGEWFKLSEMDIENIKFMLDSYHVKTDEDQMNDLIKYLSDKFNSIYCWDFLEERGYYIYKLEGKNRKTKIPAFCPLGDCKNAKEVQVKILQNISEKEDWYKHIIDSSNLEHLITQEKTEQQE